MSPVDTVPGSTCCVKSTKTLSPRLGVVMHACSPRNQEVEARGSGVQTAQTASATHRHFETSLGYRKLSPKKKKKTNEEKSKLPICSYAMSH